jgi:phospholipid transport system substrate-binding protein
MLKRKHLGVFFVVFGLIFANTSVWADGPMDDIRRTTEKLLSILGDSGLKCDERARERRERIRATVDERFDWEAISRRSLSSKWNELSEEERRQFTDLFGKLVEQTYMDRLENYSGEKVIYLDEEIGGNKAKVRVKIISDKNQEIPVEYRMEKKKGNWMVYDILIEGVSLVKNYRVQFNDILTKSSYSELLSRLKAKVQEQPKGGL